VLDQALNGTLKQLCDDVNAALVEAVQLRWGCQRVTTTIGKGQYQDRQTRVVGPIAEEGRRAGSAEAVDGARVAELDEDMFAADLAFLSFLYEAQYRCEAEGVPTAYLVDRIQTRLIATEHNFIAVAAELTQLRAAFAKAEDIQAAGGWAPETYEVADAKLALMVNRQATIHFVLDTYRPDLMPADLAEAPDKGFTNPVMAHFAECGGFEVLQPKLGYETVAMLHRLALAWPSSTDDREAIGAEYKRIFKEATGQMQVAA
jgi:hypothetical protein